MAFLYTKDRGHGNILLVPRLNVYPSVQAAFLPFTKPLEGVTYWMYSDIKDLVTTGIGDLIDPMYTALGLEWVHKTDNSPASQAEIEAEWKYVKSRTDLEKDGGFIFASITNLRLTEAAVEKLVNGRLEMDDAYSTKRFQNYATAPADAQLGVLSMDWAAGAGFKYPKFSAAFLANDFETCAAECLLNPQSVYTKRNAATVLCFKNAAQVVAQGLDPSILNWPNVLTAPTA
jgi:hypothetical protein